MILRDIAWHEDKKRVFSKCLDEFSQGDGTENIGA